MDCNAISSRECLHESRVRATVQSKRLSVLEGLVNNEAELLTLVSHQNVFCPFRFFFQDKA